MPARLTIAVGFYSNLAAAFLLIASAAAAPGYKAKTVADFFSEVIDKHRSICFGTASDCPPKSAPSAAKFDLLVTFDFDSDRLTSESKENLDQFVDALHDPRLKGQRFEIDGHTDATGAEEYNFELSERRAASVVTYLTSKGVDGSYLRPKGFGKAKPRVTDPFSAINRRVETHLLDEQN